MLALQRRTDHLGAAAPEGVSRQRLWHIRARQVVLATGAHERPLVFAGNDRPGVMLAGAVRTYLNRYAVAPGSRAVVGTTNDSAYDTVADLVAAGIAVAVVVDARPELSDRAAEVAAATGVRVLTGSAVVDTAGEHRLTGVTVQALDAEGRLTGEPQSFACDLLAVSGGWSPVVHLHSQRQGTAALGLRTSPRSCRTGPYGTSRSSGRPGGRTTSTAVWPRGHGPERWRRRRQGSRCPYRPRSRGAHPAPTRALWLVPASDGEPGTWDSHFVDLQRDVTVADVWRSTGAGMRGVEHVKRYTSLGTANDQGKTSGVNAIGVIAEALGGLARRDRHHGLPGAVHAGRLRRPGRA